MKNLQMIMPEETENNMQIVFQQINTLEKDLKKWFVSLPMSIIAHFGNTKFDVNMPFVEINDRLNFCIDKFENLTLEQKMKTFLWLNDVIKNGNE